MNDKFVYYWLSRLEEWFATQRRVGGVPTIDRTTVENVEIPVPPIEAQREIVRILDTFTEHTAELKAELKARYEQYKYYRNSLLDFENPSDFQRKMMREFVTEKVEYRKLGEVTYRVRGKGMTKDDIGSGEIPIILYGELYTKYGLYIDSVISHASKEASENATMVKTNDILLPLSSTTKKAQIGKASVLRDKSAFLGGDALSLTCGNSVDPAFLAYYLNSGLFESQKMKCVSGTTIQHLSPDKMCEIAVPVPPLEMQRRIVHILDNFDFVCNDLKIGLPAEIEARQKQYEYYRNKLLDFRSYFANTERERERENLLKLWMYVIDVRDTTLSSVCNIETGKLNANAATIDGQYAFFTTAKETSYTDTYRWNTEALLIAGNANVGDVKHYCGKFNAYQRTYVLTDFANHVNVNFLYYILTAHLKNYLDSNKNEAAMTYIVLSTLENFSFIIPPIEIQNKIVSILDKFSALVEETTGLLPKEIKLVQKRYEYYRDKLLSFNKT